MLTHSTDQAATDLLEKVLVYRPSERLHGPSFLADPYFDDLFNVETMRNGKMLDTITQKDREDALNGDRLDSDSGSVQLSDSFNNT
ncbi:unnamed protein product [Anisakis simplex]|uniref:ABC transporter ATP-binding protein n=1 Tax=Anisakis simplex TaxID=6269 RepID=A0A0M3J392_ANISI|nr:unnamed protein product [Anisakis simplex]